MVALHKLEGENIKREERDLSVLNNLENKIYAIFLCISNKISRLMIKIVLYFATMDNICGSACKEEDVTPTKNVTKNYNGLNGLPSKLTFMLTHTYILHLLFY